MRKTITPYTITAISEPPTIMRSAPFFSTVILTVSKTTTEKHVHNNCDILPGTRPPPAPLQSGRLNQCIFESSNHCKLLLLLHAHVCEMRSSRSNPKNRDWGSGCEKHS
jgi:hypothetical protein